MLNAVELMLLMEHDQSCLLADWATHTGTLRGNLYGRLLVLTIHESLKVMKSLLGPRFREQLVGALGEPEADAALKQLHSAVCKTSDNCEKQFGDLRDGLVAHRDHDADIRFALLEAATEHQVAGLAVSVLEVTTKLLPY